MDKISGIIPSSSRVTSTDMRESNPVRPGTPGFGRREGVSALKEKEAAKARSELKAETTAQKGVAVQQDANDWKMKDSARAELATQLSDKFFNRSKEAKEPAQPQEGVREMEAVPSQRDIASKPAGFKTDELGASLRAANMRPVESFGHEEQDEEVGEMPRMKQPEGLFPKGSFIDRTA